MGFIRTVKQKVKTTSIVAGQEKRITSEKVKRYLAEQKAKRLQEEIKRREAEAKANKPKLSRSQRAIKISNDIAKGFDTAGRIASRTPIMQPPRSVKAYAQDHNDISGYLANFMPNQPRRKVQYIDDGLDYEAYLRRFQSW